MPTNFEVITKDAEALINVMVKNCFCPPDDDCQTGCGGCSTCWLNWLNKESEDKKDEKA